MFSREWGGDTTVVYRLPLCQAKEANAEKPLSAKELGEMWKALSEEDKAPFNAKAADLKAAYDANKPPSKTEQKKAAKAEVRTPGILRLAETVATFTRSQLCNDRCPCADERDLSVAMILLISGFHDRAPPRPSPRTFFSRWRSAPRCSRNSRAFKPRK
jgi:hypothetical protein